MPLKTTLYYISFSALTLPQCFITPSLQQLGFPFPHVTTTLSRNHHADVHVTRKQLLEQQHVTCCQAELEIISSKDAIAINQVCRIDQ